MPMRPSILHVTADAPPEAISTKPLRFGVSDRPTDDTGGAQRGSRAGGWGRAWLKAARCLPALFVAGCFSNSDSVVSGQTGSPNQEDPPSYQTPGAPSPDGDFSEDGTSGGFGPERSLIPHPKPNPGPVELDDYLLLGGVVLTVVDIRDPGDPEVVAHFEMDGTVTPVAAPSRDFVVVAVDGAEPKTFEEIPPGNSPRVASRLAVLDLTKLDDIRIRAGLDAPRGVGDVTAQGSGITLLGGGKDLPGSLICSNDNGDLGFESYRNTQASDDLWLKRFTLSDSDLHLAAEIHFGTGYWEVSTDRQTATAIPTSSEGFVNTDLPATAFDLTTLSPLTELELDPTTFDGAGAFALSADIRNDTILLSAPSAILAFDDSGAQLGLVSVPHSDNTLHFLTDTLATLDGADGLLRLDDGDEGTPSLSWLAAEGRNPLYPAGYLRPFGDGFIELTATNENYTYLVGVLYTASEHGLTAVDELVTPISYRNYLADEPSYESLNEGWSVSAEQARAAFSFNVFDEALGIEREHFGVLQAQGSTLTFLEHIDDHPVLGTSALLLDDHALRIGRERVDSFGVSEQLDPLGSAYIYPTHVSFEVEVGRAWLTRHRYSDGRTALSIRESRFAAPTWLALPHVVDGIDLLDDTHIAVFGLSVPANCDAPDESIGDLEGSECLESAGFPSARNGVSVIELDGSASRVLGTQYVNSLDSAAPAAGNSRRVEWGGRVRIDDAHWVLFANLVEHCASEEGCKALGVEPLQSEGGSTSSGGECDESGCRDTEEPDDTTQARISNYRRSDWMVPLDLSDPEKPRLGAVVSDGAPSELYDEGHRRGIEAQLLPAGGAGTWAYGSEEPLYDAKGASLTDVGGSPLSRWSIQFFTATTQQTDFTELIAVPGVPIAIGPANWSSDADSERTILTIDQSYEDGGTPRQELVSSSVRGQGAFVEQRVSLGATLNTATIVGERIAILSAPIHLCEDDARYALRVAIPGGADLELSDPFLLPTGSGRWWLDTSHAEPAKGLVALRGGPLDGTAIIDVRENPPQLLRYEVSKP